MPALSDYTNVYATAIEVLLAKGFQVWHDERTKLFCAERDGWDFMADSPTALLGVVAIFEHVQPSSFVDYWWRVAPPERSDLYLKLPSEPDPYVSVVRKQRG